VLSADLETYKEDEKTKPFDVYHIVDGVRASPAVLVCDHAQ
jgi:hypothetical protein